MENYFLVSSSLQASMVMILLGGGAAFILLWTLAQVLYSYRKQISKLEFLPVKIQVFCLFVYISFAMICSSRCCANTTSSVDDAVHEHISPAYTYTRTRHKSERNLNLDSLSIVPSYHLQNEIVK